MTGDDGVEPKKSGRRKCIGDVRCTGGRPERGARLREERDRKGMGVEERRKREGRKGEKEEGGGWTKRRETGERRG